MADEFYVSAFIIFWNKVLTLIHKCSVYKHAYLYAGT